MLKADFHAHCKGDPQDVAIKYTAKDLIDAYAKHEYHVIAITWHDGYGYTKKLATYARQKGILLLPGMERTLEGCHVLLINFSKSECEAITTFDKLRKIKKDKHLVIAPHPYFPFGAALQKKVDTHKDVFDALEISQFFPYLLGWNKKAEEKAKSIGVPLVGNGDVHALWQIGRTWTIVQSKKSCLSIIRAIKKGKCHPVSIKREWQYQLRELFFVAGSFIRARQKRLNRPKHKDTYGTSHHSS